MKYYYIGTYKLKDDTKQVYYDEIRDKFYAVDLDSEKIDDNSEFFDNSNELTNENEIKALKKLYKTKKAFDTFQLNTEKLTNMLQIRNIKRAKKYLKFSTALLAISLSYILYRDYGKKIFDDIYTNIKDVTIEDVIDIDYEFEIYDMFGDAITGNKTVTSEMRDVLFNDFNSLTFTNTPLMNAKAKEIAKRLLEYNFTGLDETNYIDALAYILFGNNKAISKGVSYMLDEYANKREPSEESILFGSLSIGSVNNVLEDLFIYGEKGYKKVLTDTYNIDKDELNKLIDLLDEYYSSSDPKNLDNKYQIKKDLYEQLNAFLTKYYQNKDNLTELERYILGSQIYNGDFIVSNNLFSKNVTVTRTDSQYGTYNKYFKRTTGEDVSREVYRKKLTELIEEKGSSIDYDDSDSRFLFYLYLLCYNDSVEYYNKDLLNTQTAEGLAYKIMNDVFDTEGFTTLRPEFLYAYFTSGNVNVKDLIRETRSTMSDAYSIALYVEYAKCILKENNLYPEYYTYFSEQEGKIIKYLAYYNDDEFKEMATNAIENKESLFSEFSLIPNEHEYKNEDIKKYVVEQQYENR